MGLQTQNNTQASAINSTTKASERKMISGASFAAMIIFGGILGNVLFYSTLGISISIILVVGIILVIITGLLMNSEQSKLIYILIFLTCMTIPLFGGLALYYIAKQNGLTL
ncbi:MAG: hypothetical protein ACP5MX_02535 [Candidatus Micrarchaeia archaeon]